MALAIGHKDYAKQTVVIDALREVRAPFSPEAVVGEFAPLLKSYRVTQIVGDGFLGAWLVEQFAKFGICYEPSAKPKSSLYVDLVPLINSMRIDLLDHTKLTDQLCALERRNARSGRDSIDHPPPVPTTMSPMQLPAWPQPSTSTGITTPATPVSSPSTSTGMSHAGRLTEMIYHSSS